ncbi:hypothetical protein [Thermoanaerobacterium sp. DL9XJH110]|uniref:hypothetical protein n=1 Tax=Thermoanaerobacterium sp. DL9XJH110 TaxID=3386643 RepID=UPI003BB5D2C3
MKTFRRYTRITGGHYMAMFIIRRRSEPNFAWIVSLCIFDSKRECEYWFRHQEQVVTKRHCSCGLEGVRLALLWLKDLERKIKRGDFIVIYWTDERRHRAFSYLKRFGYTEGTFLDRPCLIFRKSS